DQKIEAGIKEMISDTNTTFESAPNHLQQQIVEGESNDFSTVTSFSFQKESQAESNIGSANNSYPEEDKSKSSGHTTHSAIPLADKEQIEPEIIQESPASRSLNEIFAKPQISINDKLTPPEKELHQVISGKVLFSERLDFNSRIRFMNELFGGNTEQCNAFIEQINRCRSLEEAKSVVNSTALTKGWKAENETVQILVHLVRSVFS
ncbi:MAG: hypothetical protein NZ522_05590, partial [Chitinophagales bacterium]|nr:hypothetical protein [Chitinophagales bacterium]